MVLQIHVYPQTYDSPTFASYDLSNKIANRNHRSYHNKGVSLQDIGSLIDNLHANDVVSPSSNKRVRFSECPPEVVEIVDYSSVDINDTWYTRAQLYLIQTETKECLERLDQQQQHESEADIGLERWVKIGALKFQEHQEAAFHVVIQNNNNGDGYSYYSPSAVASAYADVGIYTKMVANTRGMKLEREVRKYNNALDKDLVVGMDKAAAWNSSNRVSRRRRSSRSCRDRNDISTYRRGSAMCRAALEEVHTALTTVRKLGLHNMPKSSSYVEY